MSKKADPKKSNLVMVRIDPVLLVRMETLAKRMTKDERNQGREVTRNDVLRQSADIGFGELERRWSS
jgi:hypothetical protein